jgi:glycosyltransferase involved in cell wall biosynthesis
MLFSIIVPAYNVKDYLNECVQGILEQSFSDFELILVDDGSTDGTGSLCDTYASQNERIRVIHQPNCGLSDARNAGMKVARGEYLVFIDGDDYIMRDSLKNFAEKLVQRPDVLITRLVEAYSYSSFRKMDQKMREDFDTDKRSVFKWVFSESENTWPSQKYIVKRRLVVEAGLKFPKGRFHEDIDWTAKLFSSADSFSFCCYYWYYHRINRSGQITGISRPLDVIDIVSKNVHDDGYRCLDAQMKTLLFERLVMSIFSAVVSSYSQYNLEEQIKIVAALSENADLFKHAIKLKHRLFLALARAFGLRVALEITSFLYTLTLQKMSRRKRSVSVL